MFDKNTLTGKHILVTGGGSGLGLAMAQKFYTLGAQVAICGRTESKLKQATVQIGEGSLYYVCDVRDPSAVTAMFDYLIEQWDRVDGLVNNAAGNFLAASEDLSPNAFASVVDIVLKGTFHCTLEFGNRLIQKNSTAPSPQGASAKEESNGQSKESISSPCGNIINIVTTYTETGSAFVLPSACAKAGVLAMTNSLAVEWSTYGIRLNAIAPGPFPTEGAWSRLMPDPSIEEAYKRGIPLGRYGQSEELANLAAFLMSPMADYIQGGCISIDGGERLMAGQFNRFVQWMPRPMIKQAFGAMKPPKNPS
ncbi:MAG: SDR family oxidoreductase [Sphingomonadales bacterium]|nr:SDR family oxidoreductase [Sphingomonadales bacterium]